MREIKFRVWMSNDFFPDGHMYYAGDRVDGRGMLLNLFGDLFTTIPNDVGEPGMCCRARWANNDINIMQFTGLTDKNGREIYEGDLLKSEGETKTKPFDAGREVYSPWWEISEVVFDQGSYRQIIRKQHNSYFAELPSPPRDIFRSQEYKEVIGNIHDNPDLLK